jgi:hypothetical protein
MSESQRRDAPAYDEVDRAQQKGLRISRDSLRRYFGHDLERRPDGRIYAKKSDRSYHGDMRIVSTEGLVERPVRGSNVRRRVSEHANAVQRYLHGDDPEGHGLVRFEGKRVGGVELETNLDRLDRLQRSGEVDFLDLYTDRDF